MNQQQKQLQLKIGKLRHPLYSKKINKSRLNQMCRTRSKKRALKLTMMCVLIFGDFVIKALGEENMTNPKLKVTVSPKGGEKIQSIFLAIKNPKDLSSADVIVLHAGINNMEKFHQK